MAYNESIVAYFGGDTKGLQEAVEEASILMKGFSRTAGRSIGEIAKGFGGVLVGAELVKGFLEASKAAQELRKSAMESGQAIDDNIAAMARVGDVLDAIKHGAVEAFGAVADWVQKGVIGLSSFVVGTDTAGEALDLLNKKAADPKMGEALKKLGEAEKEASLAGADGWLKVARLMGQVRDLQAELAKLDADSVPAVEKRTEIVKKQAELTRTIAEQKRKDSAEDERAEQTRVSLLQKSLDLDDKRLALIRETKPLQQQVNELKGQEAKLQQEILDPTLTVKELLEKENDLLDVQKDLREKNKELAKETAEAQKIQTELTAKNNKLYADFMSQMLGFGDKRDFTAGSTASLEEIVRRDRSKIGTLDPGTAFNYGDSLQITQLQNEANKAQRELDFRNKTLQDVQTGGIDMARRNFQGDPLQFDKVLQSLTTGLDANKQSADTLKRIEDFLTQR